MRRSSLTAAVFLIAATALGALALAATTTQRDKTRETNALKRKPEFDITRTKVGVTPGGKVKHAVTMVGKLTPKKLYSRPFLLINKGTSRGGRAEFLVLGPRIFKIPKDENADYKKVGAAKIRSHRKTWTYKFDPALVGSETRPYGWQVRTLRGRTEDRFPARRWAIHRH